MNGTFVDASNAYVSVFDHGLLYGDGVFDTIAAVNGRIFWLDEHIDRLLNGCGELSIEPPWTRDMLIKWTRQLFELNHMPTARLRITVTRGEGGIPIYELRKCRPNLIIFSTPLDLPPDGYYQRGLSLKTVSYERIHPRVKSLSFLASILGYLDASAENADDAVFVNRDSAVSEGATFNVFAVSERTLFTAADGILMGITRAKVCDLARHSGYSVVEHTLPLSKLLEADEAFITGTTKRLVPVCLVNGRLIGGGIPGAVTRDLLARFRSLYF